MFDQIAFARHRRLRKWPTLSGSVVVSKLVDQLFRMERFFNEAWRDLDDFSINQILKRVNEFKSSQF